MLSMPRFPRRWIAIEGLAHHKIWRGHNKEYNVASFYEKFLYLTLLAKTQESQNPLHAFCLMSNHVHEVYQVDDLNSFSNFMRRHHGQYGQTFNRLKRRSGKVAQDRPKTIPIENHEHEMRVTFYIHANPIRAGMVKDAGQHVYSTHKLYSYGSKPSWLRKIARLRISFPAWYLALGRTMRERQRRYRQLFEQYLRESGLRRQEHSVYGAGSLLWVSRRREQVLGSWLRHVRAVCQSPP